MLSLSFYWPYWHHHWFSPLVTIAGYCHQYLSVVVVPLLSQFLSLVFFHCCHQSPSLIIVSHIYNSIMRTLLLATLLLVLLLDIFAMADDDIDRTFKLFKKKKEKVKDKIKKPSYKPDQRTFFKKKNKDKPKKPSYKPSYHPPSYHPEPYHPPSYQPEPYHGKY